MSSTPHLELLGAEPGADALTGADALVVGVRPGQDGADPVVVGGTAALGELAGELPGLVALLGGTGKAEEVTRVPTRGALGVPVVLAVGLGPEPAADAGAGEAPDLAEQVRRAAGAAARALHGHATHVVTTLSTLDLAAAVEGTLLGDYGFTAYKKTPSTAPTELARVGLVSAHGSHGAHQEPGDTSELTRATAVARWVAAARDLVNTPPNDLYPDAFAERARTLAEGAGVSVEILDEFQLAEHGYGGVLGVGGGSSRPPRLVRLTYRPANPVKKIALVGKGITFDTGGISIKPAANMDHMTSDMSGAAGVVAATCLAAELGLDVEVVATVPMAENMPSGTAYRPGDVLTMYGGTTVEVLNTDAEGRLVLGDAIARACEDAPDYLLETSTLTGAQLVALGSRTPGVMGTDAFRDRVAARAVAAGDGGWAMPLAEELRGDLDSRVADLANVTNHRFGGMLVGGIFLREFVADGVPWVHLDIAGPAFNTGGPHGYTPKGGTGVPVRTIAAVLDDIAHHG
ncbi:putative cytosol aminopeptidase [Actinomycetospora sp. NBRC 106375]|uniref:leucyl aminopeptidase n=1 Tax=Actinomycetospora sp. NBRC 106375 TaxID=3032207 RepID=UPI0024A38BE5|nr:leucyl aminopeptidase [Actinomycetospora sp. NBRC 106375]GLZ47435.1 putative cytosol aminopeptidase [Actinomycetospora sp. NBRC 106375]